MHGLSKHALNTTSFYRRCRGFFMSSEGCLTSLNRNPRCLTPTCCIVSLLPSNQ
jgi:hypothetical protein